MPAVARPRSDEARRAALEATLDLLAANGVDGVTFEEVAARSGVAKSTLYRHFGTKQAMLVEAANSCFVEQSTPDTGDLLEDLREIVRKGSDTEDKHRVPDVLPPLLALARAPPRLAGDVRVRHLPPARSPALGVDHADAGIRGAGPDGAGARADVDDRRRREALDRLRLQVDPEAGPSRVESEPREARAPRARTRRSRRGSSCHAVCAVPLPAARI